MLFIRKFFAVSFIGSLIMLSIILLKGNYVSLGNMFNEDIFSNIRMDEVIGLASKKVKQVVDDEVLLRLIIPSIEFDKDVYNINSVKNNVNKNVYILNNSREDVNLYFFASHSGGGRGSYFDNLRYLEIGNEIWLYKDREKLGYVVDKIYFIEKNGYFDVSYGEYGNRIFLITCSLDYKGKQLVVSGNLVYKV